jgi:hypothetical protein
LKQRAASGGYRKKIVEILGNTGNKWATDHECLSCQSIPSAAFDALEVDHPAENFWQKDSPVLRHGSGGLGGGAGVAGETSEGWDGFALGAVGFGDVDEVGGAGLHREQGGGFGAAS